jgi:hypothetical protein
MTHSNISPTLARLLGRYRTTYSVWTLATKAADVPSPAPMPRVQHAYVLKGDRQIPLYCHSVLEIDQREQQRLRINSMWSKEVREKPDAQTRQFYARLREELQQQIAERDRIERESGWAELQEKADQAQKAQDAAVKALLAHRPENLDEVAAVAEIILGRIKAGVQSDAESKRYFRTLGRCADEARAAAA